MSKDSLESKLSARARETEPSGIRKIFDLAATLKSPIDFSIGKPDFDVPDALKDDCVSHIRAGRNAYTPSAGLPELKDKLLTQARATGGRPDAAIVTCGVSGALTLAILALAGPGDDVLIPDPYFVSYKQLVSLAGARPVLYSTYPSFSGILEPIRRAFTDKTKLVILSSPANPTGVSASSEELNEAVKFIESRGAVILSDEIYSAFCYDAPFKSVGSISNNAVVLGGLSKTHAMTGWRLGWALGPAPFIDAMTKFQQFTFVCAPSMVQYAALKALDMPVDNVVVEYRRKRDMICGGLETLGYRFVKPDGAFYVFPEAPGGNGTAFVERALKRNLLLVPGGVFSAKDTHFRIAYAVSDEMMARGLDALAELIKS
jgi:aspartate aminotransferase/aminotransferase